MLYNAHIKTVSGDEIMKKKIYLFVIFIATALCCVALSACSIFGGGGKTEKTQISDEHIYKGDSLFTNTYEYTGEPITLNTKILEFRVNNQTVPLTNFEFGYENNIEAGTATLIITCTEDNPYLYGTLRKNFTIVPQTVTVLDFETLKEKLVKNAHVNTLSGITVPEGETLTVPNGAILEMQLRTNGDVNFTNLGTIINNGTIKIGCNVYVGNSYTRVNFDFINEGSIINNGTVAIEGYPQKGGMGTLYQSGNFENNGTVKNAGGRIYTDTSIEAQESGDAVYVLRERITASDVSLTDPYVSGSDVIQNGMTYAEDRKFEPNVSVNGGFVKQVAYQNNDRAGTASATVAVGPRNTAIYGEVTVEFAINKGSISGIADYAQLKSLVQSGNYCNYSVGQGNRISIPADETLTLAADESLSVYTLDVYGTLENNGAITVGDSTASTAALEYLNVYGTLKNNGSIKNMRSFSLFSSGTLENNGSFSVQPTYFSRYLNIRGEIKNNGTFYSKAYSNTFYSGSSVINSSSGSINFEYFNKSSGSVQFEKMNMVNEGFVKCNAAMFCRDAFTKFENNPYADGKGFTMGINGHAWTYYPLENVDGDVTVYKRLADVEIVMYESVDGEDVLYSAQMPYDAKSHTPNVKIEGQKLDSSLYSVSYAYVDGASEASVSKAGVINVTVTITSPRCDYADSVDLSFEIVRSVFNAESSDGLLQAINDNNYHTVKLQNDITLDRSNPSSPTAVLLDGMTLDTNGYRLTINTDFTNYGTVCVRPKGGDVSEDNCGLIVSGINTLTNKGAINNEGLILYERGHLYGGRVAGGIEQSDGGQTVNDGVIYTVQDFEWTGDGTVHTRQLLESGNVSLEYDSTVYDGEEKTPAISAVGFPQEDFDDCFTYSYSNNSNAGTASVELTFTKGKFDARYAVIEDITVNFTVERAEYFYRLSNTNSYISGLNRLLKNDNYYKVTLVGEQTVNLSEDVVVPSGKILDIGDSEIEKYIDYTLTIEKGGQLWAGVNSLDRLSKYSGLAHKIYFTADFGVKTDKVNFIGGSSTFIKGFDITVLEIDLNGFGYYGRIVFGDFSSLYYISNVSLTITDSSPQKTGFLGTEDYAEYALEVKEKYSLNIQGAKICGLSLTASSNAAVVLKDCTFANSKLAGITIYSYPNGGNSEISGCVFEGACGAEIGAGVTGLVFSGCTFRGTGAATSSKHGAGIYVSALKPTFSVTLRGGKVESHNGNGIEIFKFNSSDELNGDVVYDSETEFDVYGNQKEVVTA